MANRTGGKADPLLSLKKVFSIGSNIVIIIDKSIVNRLAITEESTLFQQEIVEDGILLHIVRKPELDLQSGN